MRTGDVLLIQGPSEQIATLREESELLVLDATTDLPHRAGARLALLIMAAVVLFAAFGVVSIAISAVCGVLLMILGKCLRWHDVTVALSTPVILIVVASLALGIGLLETGAANYLEGVFVAATTGASPALVLSGLILGMGILTNVVSSNAAAVIGAPISHQHRPAAGVTGRALCAGRHLRFQPLLRNPTCPQDQRAGDERRWLHILRLRPNWGAAADHHVACLLVAATGHLWALASRDHLKKRTPPWWGSFVQLMLVA